MPIISTNVLVETLQKHCNFVVTYPSAKIPLNPANGQRAAVNDPSTWGTLEAAQAAIASHPELLLGFVLTSECRLVCIDLDLYKTSDHTILSYLRNTHDYFNSYSEWSPHGGIHLWLRGSLQRGRRCDDKYIEVYPHSRFITITGNTFNNVPVAQRQQQLDELMLQFPQDKPDAPTIESQPQTKTDEAICNLAANATNGDLFKQLWYGKWKECGYPSQSEGDLAFLNIVAFYTDSKEQAARIYYSSPLFQNSPKRERKAKPDYLFSKGYGLIEKAWDQKVAPGQFAGIEAAVKQAVELTDQAPLPDQPFNVQSAKGISLICGPDIEDIPQEWIIPDFIPDKTLTGIYGMSGIGKTTFAVGLAAFLSKVGAVIILTNEDGPSHIKRMFVAMGGNIANLYVENSATEDMPWLLNDCASVEKAMIQLKPRIIVIDSFYSHTPSKVDTDGHAKVAPLLIPLRKLSNKYCPILLIHHDNKSSATDPAQKAGGSHGIVSTIRHNVRVTENPDSSDMRVVTVFNTNVGKLNPPALQFQLNPFQFSTERVDITAQEAIQPPDNLATNATKQIQGKIAQGWLLKQLANGPRLAKELTALALEQINIKYDTLNRARKFLCIESTKLEDNSNQWSLPKKEKK